MTSAEPGEPLAVYLGAAGELVPPEGSPSISGRCSRSFHESRAGGSACAPSSPSSARVCGGAASDSFPEPPRGLSLPPPCYICGSATALVLQIHAPLLPSYPDRALLFFACVSDGDRCSRKQEAWVGVRVQGPRAAAEPRPCSSEGARTAAPPPPLPPPPTLPPSAPAAAAPAPFAADSWGLESEKGGGAGGWGIGGDEAAETNNDDEKRVDFSRLGAELSSAAEALQISGGGGGSSRKPRGKRHQLREQGGDSEAQKKEGDKEEEGAGAKSPALLWTQPGDSGPTLPSFYVSWAPEEEAGRSSSAASSQRNKSGNSKGCCDPESSSIDDAHVAELLARYEASERSGGGSGSAAAAAAKASSSPPSPATGGAAAAAKAEALASSRLADAAGWSGEAYEPDSAPGASSAFLAFAKRLARSPEQVARYYSCRRRGGSGSDGAAAAASAAATAAATAAAAAAAAASSPRLLWPAAQGPPDPPPPCRSCGSAREYEAQLMAPLVALIDEAGQWEEEEEGEEEEEEASKNGEEQKQQRRRRRRRQGRPALRRAPESWEWLTVAMATCVAGCSGGHGGGGGGGDDDAVVAVEEAVAVAFE